MKLKFNKIYFMDELTSSLTKGSVLIKPKSSPKKKRTEYSCSEEHYYPKFQKENDQNKLARYKAYTACWQSISSQITEIQQNESSKVLEALVDFVSRVHQKEKQGCISYPINEIPTAGFLTGINLTDFDVVFSQLADCLKENVTPYTVILHSKDNTSLKLLFQNTFDGLYRLSTDESIDDKEENISGDDADFLLNTSMRKRNPYFKDYTFKELVVWYEEQTGKAPQPKLKSSIGGKRPIVLVFEDFERFPSMILQDFILIASEYMDTLPLVIVFGVATSISAIHKSLPHLVSSRLSIEKFQSQPSLALLSKIMDQVMLSNKHPFKLGPAVSQLLYDRFLELDFSISNFITALKFSILDHFCVKEFSLLCTFDQTFIKEFIEKLSSNRLKMFREIPSYLKFYDRQSQSEQKKLNGNENYFKQTLVDFVEDLQAHEKNFFPVVKCLYELTSNLHNHPFGKRLRDVYCFATIKPKLYTENKFVNAMTLARMLPRDELSRVVTSSIDILTNACIDASSDFSGVISELLEHQTQFNELEIGTSKYDKIVESTAAVTPTTTKIYKSRYEFQEQMKSAMQEKRKLSPYDRLRNDVIDTLESLFKKHLISPMEMTLHEIFYYNDSYTVKQRIDGSPKEKISKALSNPQSYLKCKCCKQTENVEKSKTDSVNSAQPDVCVLYQLHLECGRLINLYDWLQTYMVLVEPSLDDNKKKKKTKQRQKLEDQLQARFIRGCSELQHMGFIKSTKKKTDHVSRLTWGGC